MCRAVILCLVIATTGCDGSKYRRFPEDSGEGVPGDEDQEGPLLNHTPVGDGQPAEQEVQVSCTALDPESGVVSVTIYYKQETSSMWNAVELRPVDDEGSYEGAIPAEDVGSGGIDYYLSAMDREENVSSLPEDATDEVYHFRVSAD